MIRNYIKIAWRNLIKNKGLTGIHLIGLSTGFAITLLICIYVRYEMSYEKNNLLANNVVRLTMDYMDGATVTSQDCETYPPLGPRVKEELPEVKSYARAYGIGEPNVALQIGNKQFSLKKVFAVDSDFLNMFNYKLIFGSQEDVLNKPNEVVLTESQALIFFNRKDIVGETFKLIYNNEQTILTVVGVCLDSPSNTHFKFNMLVSYSSLYANPLLQAMYGEEKDNWDGNNTYTYVQLASGVNYNSFSKKLNTFSQRLIDEKKIKSERVVGQKITDIHLYSQKTFEPEINGDGKSIFYLLGIAFLVIISAFVNYINLATSKALDRAKEVGIKKVVGSSKRQLRIQFLLEAFLISLLAGIISLALVWISKNHFISLSGIPENTLLFNSVMFWGLLISFILLGSFLSGIYPAFVLSSFKPIQVLNGKFSQSKKGVFLRKSLVVFQFSITIILLIQTFTVREQLNYMRSLDKGVNISKTIIVEAPSQRSTKENYTVFKDELLTNTSIKKISLSHTVPGQSISELSTTADISLKGITPEHYHNFYLTFTDEAYLSLLGVELLAGKDFDKSSSSKNNVVVNEEALLRWNIHSPKEAINKQLVFWGREWTIIGVVKNYHQQSPKSPYIPMLHLYSDTFRSLASIQFSNNSPLVQLKEIKEVYSRVYPGAPFSYFFMDESYNKQFRADERFQVVFTILTGFAILIACLGLLGLVAFSVAKRKKEIGIRKIIGASTINILILITKDYFKIILLSVIIGLPITYVIVKNWLNNFAFKIDLYWWIFVIPIAFIFVLVLVSISAKTIKIAMKNPVNSLKTE